MRQLYLLFIWGLCEPTLYGPYSTVEDLERRVRELDAEYGNSEHLFFALTAEDGKLLPDIGGYDEDFFKPKPREAISKAPSKEPPETKKFGKCTYKLLHIKGRPIKSIQEANDRAQYLRGQGFLTRVFNAGDHYVVYYTQKDKEAPK